MAVLVLVFVILIVCGVNNGFACQSGQQEGFVCKVSEIMELVWPLTCLSPASHPLLACCILSEALLSPATPGAIIVLDPS